MKDNVVLVTGGGRGIGRAFALGFAQAGADIAICSRDTNELETVANEIKNFGRRALAIKTDVSNSVEVNSMVDKIITEFGQIDVLINNAAICILGTLMETNEEVWDKNININLKGCYFCCRAVVPHMIKRKKGNIISIASISGFKAMPRQLAYGISKAGITMLTRSLARELGQYNIRVNAIAPGTTNTKMNEPESKTEEFVKARLPNIPLGRFAEPIDIAGAALFLASDTASWITGHTLVIDGGYLA